MLSFIPADLWPIVIFVGAAVLIPYLLDTIGQLLLGDETRSRRSRRQHAEPPPDERP